MRNESKDDVIRSLVGKQVVLRVSRRFPARPLKTLGTVVKNKDGFYVRHEVKRDGFRQLVEIPLDITKVNATRINLMTIDTKPVSVTYE
jgi:hypothetical protein